MTFGQWRCSKCGTHAVSRAGKADLCRNCERPSTGPRTYFPAAGEGLCAGIAFNKHSIGSRCNKPGKFLLGTSWRCPKCYRNARRAMVREGLRKRAAVAS